MKFKNIIETIFSVKNVNYRKQIMVFGLKIRFKTKKLEARKLRDQNNYKTNNYKTIIKPYIVCREKGYTAREDTSYSCNVTGLLSYQILNKMKEIDLKRKIKEGKKVRVCFFLDTLSKFSTNSIYRAMEKNDLFDPFIILGDTYERAFENELIWEKHLRELKILQESGYTAYSLYNEKRAYIPIEKLKFDIIFLSVPFLDNYSGIYFSNIYANTNYLVCYISYAFMSCNLYDYFYNNRRINTAWKNFVLSRSDYDEYMRFSTDFGINAVLMGYPKLDAYAKSIEDCKIPDKLSNGKPIVIYAPHHSVRGLDEPNDIGTFDIYCDYFLNLVKKYPEINFVFKPHPSLGTFLNKNKIMTYEQYDDYIREWNELPNGFYEIGGEYIDLFKKSSLMITDTCSFIGEYLPSDNPCMYLVKPSRNQETYMDGFTLSARKILNTYYLCHNSEEIEQYFNMIMFDKKDPMKEERKKIKDEIFINIGSAGQKIVDYLTELLID